MSKRAIIYATGSKEDLIVLHRKCDTLAQMVQEAKAENKNLDNIRSEYQRQAGKRDERKEALNNINSQIEELKIMYQEAESSIPEKERQAGETLATRRQKLKNPPGGKME